MRPLSDWLVVGVLSGVAIAGQVARLKWRRVALEWHRIVMSQEIDVGKMAASVLEARAHASALIADYRSDADTIRMERDRLAATLKEIDRVVGRRPPRRRWLALSRRIARMALDGMPFMLALIVLTGCNDNPVTRSSQVTRYVDDSVGVVCYLWGHGPGSQTAAISCVRVR